MLRQLTVEYQNPVSLYKILPVPGGSARQTSGQKCVTNLILNFRHFKIADLQFSNLDAIYVVTTQIVLA